MIKFKKGLIVVLTVVLLFCFTGCNYVQKQGNKKEIDRIKEILNDDVLDELEINWIDTEVTDFIINYDYEVADKRYVVSYMKKGLMNNIVINKETGEIIPTAKYDSIGQYFEGRAIANYCDRKLVDGGSGYTVDNNKYGFVDIEGNEIIPIIYDEAHSFSEGLAAVKKGQYSGYIDNKGNTVIPFEYTWAQSFKGGYASVGKINKNGEKLSGIIDKKGSFTKVEGVTNISEFNNGIARAWDKYDKEVLIDVNGKLVDNSSDSKNEFLKKYHEVRDYKEGRAIVGYFTQRNEQCKYGVIDENGKEIIPLKYCYIYDYSEGMTSALLDLYGKLAYFDIEGNKITPFKYSVTSDFHEGAAIVGTGNYKDGTLLVGAINKYGNEIVPLEFYHISNFNKGYALVGLGKGDNPYVTTSKKLGILKLPGSVNKNDGSNKLITATFNGENIEFDQDPIIDEDTVLIPLRAILDVTGAAITWDDNIGKVTVAKDNIKIEIQIGVKEAFINGESYIMDVPARLVNGRILVPIVFISKCFNYDVDWNQDTQTIIITQ